MRIVVLSLALCMSSLLAEPLVKPVVPGKSYTRVEYPLKGGNGECFHFKATTPTQKSGKNKDLPSTTPNVAEIEVGLCSTLPMITVKTAEKWGYNNVGAGQKLTIPSILLTGEATLMGKRCEVNIKLTNIVVDVYKAAYGTDEKILGADILLTPEQLWLVSPNLSEFWMTFEENATAQVSYPTTQVKKVKEFDDKPSATEVKADAELLPVRIPLQPKSYNFDMKVLHATPVGTKSKNCMLEIAFTNRDYVYMTRGMADEYKIKLGDDAPMVFGADMTIKGASAVASNVRLTSASGAGWKTPVEMHYKEIGMLIGLEAMHSNMCLTPGYLIPRIQQMLLAVGTDGIPRIYGYTNKDMTIDPKKTEPKKIEPKKK